MSEAPRITDLTPLVAIGGTPLVPSVVASARHSGGARGLAAICGGLGQGDAAVIEAAA